MSHLLALGANPVPPEVWLPPAASAPTRFRNKAKMVVSGTVGAPVLGILDSELHGVDLRRCPLHVPEIEAALPVVAGLIAELGLRPYDVRARRGELKHVLVTASPDGDLMVRLVLRSHTCVERLRRTVPRFRSLLPTLAVLSVNIQPVHQAVIEGADEHVLTDGPGGDRLLMRLHLPAGAEEAHGAGRHRSGELPLFLPTRSFFQTNTAVAECLYATARDWAREAPTGFEDGSARPSGGDRPQVIWDLFCGVGGFALALAGPGRQVLGVELSAPAIDGARAAAALMGLDPRTVRFEVGDARVLDPGGGGPVPDLLVVNPPRRGIGAELAGRIEAAGVRRVLYSSCNPTSLARDLEAMGSLRVRRARLFDMFPHTDHAEVLVELVR